MNRILTDGVGLIFMKIGIHAQEPVEKIIERKKREYDETGKIFWGYGGNTCHPTNFVQPFAKNQEEDGAKVYLVMHKMTSNHFAEPKLADEYSDDGVNWQPIPNGIHVRGSRYAMVIEDLTEENFDLSLRNLAVAVGPKRGTSGVNYIRGRVDKGCFEYHETGQEPGDDEQKHIDLYAPLQPPYAVFLR